MWQSSVKVASWAEFVILKYSADIYLPAKSPFASLWTMTFASEVDETLPITTFTHGCITADFSASDENIPLGFIASNRNFTLYDVKLNVCVANAHGGIFTTVLRLAL